jgi:hypothetical protein
MSIVFFELLRSASCRCLPRQQRLKLRQTIVSQFHEIRFVERWRSAMTNAGTWISLAAPWQLARTLSSESGGACGLPLAKKSPCAATQRRVFPSSFSFATGSLV